MKSLRCFPMALALTAAVTGLAHGRNVELKVPIADALAATDVKDRPTGAVKFFFAGQKSPEIGRAHV